MDGEVRIPIFLDIQDNDVEKELSRLHPKLEKLKANMDAIFKDRSENIKFMDTAKLALAERQLSKIRDRIQQVTDEERKDAAVANMIERNIQVYRDFAEQIDIIINKYPSLRKAMESTSDSNTKKNLWSSFTNSKELLQYMDAVQQRAERVRTMLAEAPKGDTVLDASRDRIQQNLTALQELIKKVGEYQQALAEAETTARRETSAITSLKKSGATEDEVNAQKQVAKAARDANTELEKSSAEATAALKLDIKERISAIQEEEKKFAAMASRIAQNNRLIDEEKLSGEKDTFRSKASKKIQLLEATSDAEQDVADSTNAHASAENKEAGATKSSTAQFYYKLRSIKMLGFVVNQAYSAIENFGKKSIQFVKGAISAYVKLITPISTVRKLMEKLSASTKKLSTGFKSTTKAHDGFHMSLKQALLTILKYGFGIRSLYLLINKMRQAISKGFEQMAVQFADVNERMSSIVTSMNMIKAALTSVVEPLLTVVAPLLEKISAVVSDIAYKVASFIAALTGQTAVYKAVRVQTDYAASLDKTAKNAKEAKKQLSGLDKLNVINSDKDNDSNKDKSPTMGWEKVPIDSKMKDWAEKFKDFINRLLAPIKEAWNKMKEFVKASFKYMVGQLLALGKDVARDFWRVWEEPETEEIFEDIFKIVGDIFLIIGNIAKKLREAWNYADNGYRIFKAIRDIIGIIVDGIRQVADYMVVWSDRLTFIPLFTAIADVLTDQVVPAVQKVVDLFVYLTETVLLELVRYVIEELAPIIVRAFGNIIEAIGNIAENIQKALEEGKKGEKIVAKFEGILTIIANGVLKITELIKEWAKNLNFDPFFTSVLNFLDRITPAIQFIVDTVVAFFDKVLLPFWKYLIEDGGPKLLDLLGKIFGEKYTDENGVVWGIDFEHLRQVIDELFPVLEQLLELAWETFLQIIEDVGKAFDDWVNSDSLDKIVESLKNWVNDANPEDLAKKIEKFVVTVTKLAIELGVLTKVIMPVITGIMTLANVFKQTKLLTLFKDLITAIGTGGLSGALSGLVVPIGIVVGVIATMVGAFGGVGETIKELKERFDQIKESVTQFAETIKLQDSLNGLKSAFDGFKGSLESLRPVFEFLLDAISLIASQFLNSLLGAIDGIVIAFTGLITVIKGVNEIFGGIITIAKGLVQFFTGDFKGGIDTIGSGFEEFNKGVRDIFGGLLEFIGGIITGILEALNGFAFTSLPDIQKKIGEFITGVKEFFAGLKYDLIGDPIIYDIRDGIIEGFGEWISQTAKDVGGWVKDRITDFSNLAKDVGTSVKDTTDNVVKGFGSMKKGVTDKSKELIKTAKDKFADLKRNAKDKLASSQFKPFGENAVKGIESGIKAFGTVLSAANKGINDIKQRFRGGLAMSVFRTIGKFIPDGLKSGIMSGLSSLLSTVSNMCNQIKSKAESSLRIGSPSKVFKEIGLMVDKGMEGGIEKGSDDVSDAFNALVPSEKMFDTFYDKFIDTMSSVTEDTTDMFDVMFAHIEETMQKLENMKLMTTMYNNLNNLPKIDTPNVAKGYTLPSNKAFKSEPSDVNLDKLPELMKQALIDAITETADLQTGEETIILNLDGKKVFETIRNENTKFKKQHGVSAFG